MADNLLEKFLHLRLPKLRAGLAALFACLAVLSSGAVPARAASFTASLDRDTITLGETATLSLKFEGGSPEQLPSSMTVSNLQLVLVGGPSHFDININGNRDSYDTFSYVVTPTQAGQFTIPALTANVGGKQLASQPLKLTVNKPGAPPPAGANTDSQIAFARLALPKKEVYAGETITANLQLFYRQDAQLARDPQITGTPADGFTVGKIAGGNQTLVQIGNAVFNVIPAKIALTANKTGALHVGPVTISLVLLVPSNDRQSDPFPGLFGMFRSSVQKQFSVATDTLDLNSLPLPAANVPTNFNGVVGDFTMTVTAGPTNVTAGDPITVRVQISGRGAFDGVKLPDQSGWGDFKLFQPTAKFTPADQLELSGTRLSRKSSRRKTPACMSCRRLHFHFSIPTTANTTRSRSPRCRSSSRPRAQRRCQPSRRAKIPRRKTRRRRTFCRSRKISERSRQNHPRSSRNRPFLPCNPSRSLHFSPR